MIQVTVRTRGMLGWAWRWQQTVLKGNFRDWERSSLLGPSEPIKLKCFKKNFSSINKGMDKEDVVHICNGILLSHKKWKNAICSNIGGPRDSHTQWSKSERERQRSHKIINMWDPTKNYTKELTKQKQTQRFWNQISGYQRGNVRWEGKIGGWDWHIHSTT